ncbi:MAG: NAD(+) synthase [Cyclobacteriaceae bacterium]
MAKLLIGGAALNQTPLDWQGNVSRIKEAIAQARALEISILCLPELCITGYGSEDLFLSQWFPEKALSFLDEISESCKDISVTVGLPIWLEGNLYNCACVITNQRIEGFVPKQHLAGDGVHYEPRWFTSWPSGALSKFDYNGQSYDFGDRIHELFGVKVGFEICEDAWRGDQRPACRLYEQGVQLVLNPSASHFAFHKSKNREDLVLDSSKAFECAYVYANLLGNEAGRMIFDGEILIAQQGRFLNRNELLSFKDINLTTAWIDFKQPLNSEQQYQEDDHDTKKEFTKAATLALFDYLRKSRSNGFVLSLSGGADSSTCAILVAEMVRRGISELGLENFLLKLGRMSLYDTIDHSAPHAAIVAEILTCAYQGTKNSSEATFQSARGLAESIGATFYNWDIDQEVAGYRGKIEKAIKRPLAWETDDITLQNIQARARAPIIWMLANLNNALLLATSNRSEGDVGYATMDGDTSGSISPIAAVDKTFILSWLHWVEQTLGYTGLQKVNQLDPTAELRPLESNQTDEDDLMPYPILVAIEKLAIRDHQSPIEVFDELKTKGLASGDQLKLYIIKFFKLWARNQWKRERLAPSFHLDDFNVDPKTWCRFPILSGGFVEELEALGR